MPCRSCFSPLEALPCVPMFQLREQRFLQGTDQRALCAQSARPNTVGCTIASLQDSAAASASGSKDCHAMTGSNTLTSWGIVYHSTAGTSTDIKGILNNSRFAYDDCLGSFWNISRVLYLTQTSCLWYARAFICLHLIVFQSKEEW